MVSKKIIYGIAGLGTVAVTATAIAVPLALRNSGESNPYKDLKSGKAFSEKQLKAIKTNAYVAGLNTKFGGLENAYYDAGSHHLVLVFAKAVTGKTGVDKTESTVVIDASAASSPKIVSLGQVEKQGNKVVDGTTTVVQYETDNKGQIKIAKVVLKSKTDKNDQAASTRLKAFTTKLKTNNDSNKTSVKDIKEVAGKTDNELTNQKTNKTIVDDIKASLEKLSVKSTKALTAVSTNTTFNNAVLTNAGTVSGTYPTTKIPTANFKMEYTSAGVTLPTSAKPNTGTIDVTITSSDSTLGSSVNIKAKIAVEVTNEDAVNAEEANQKLSAIKSAGNLPSGDKSKLLSQLGLTKGGQIGNTSTWETSLKTLFGHVKNVSPNITVNKTDDTKGELEIKVEYKFTTNTSKPIIASETYTVSGFKTNKDVANSITEQEVATAIKNAASYSKKDKPSDYSKKNNSAFTNLITSSNTNAKVAVTLGTHNDHNGTLQFTYIVTFNGESTNQQSGTLTGFASTKTASDKKTDADKELNNKLSSISLNGQNTKLPSVITNKNLSSFGELNNEYGVIEGEKPTFVIKANSADNKKGELVVTITYTYDNSNSSTKDVTLTGFNTIDNIQTNNLKALKAALTGGSVSGANLKLKATDIAQKINSDLTLKAELGIDLTSLAKSSKYAISVTGDTSGKITVSVTMTTTGATKQTSTAETLVVNHKSDADLAKDAAQAALNTEQTRVNNLKSASATVKTGDSELVNSEAPLTQAIAAKFGITLTQNKDFDYKYTTTATAIKIKVVSKADGSLTASPAPGNITISPTPAANKATADTAAAQAALNTEQTRVNNLKSASATVKTGDSELVNSEAPLTQAIAAKFGITLTQNKDFDYKYTTTATAIKIKVVSKADGSLTASPAPGNITISPNPAANKATADTKAANAAIDQALKDKPTPTIPTASKSKTAKALGNSDITPPGSTGSGNTALTYQVTNVTKSSTTTDGTTATVTIKVTSTVAGAKTTGNTYTFELSGFAKQIDTQQGEWTAKIGAADYTIKGPANGTNPQNLAAQSEDLSQFFDYKASSKASDTNATLTSKTPASGDTLEGYTASITGNFNVSTPSLDLSNITLTETTPADSVAKTQGEWSATVKGATVTIKGPADGTNPATLAAGAKDLSTILTFSPFKAGTTRPATLVIKASLPAGYTITKTGTFNGKDVDLTQITLTQTKAPQQKNY